jgi:hypothetical protein
LSYKPINQTKTIKSGGIYQVELSIKNFEDVIKVALTAQVKDKLILQLGGKLS